MEGSGGVHLSPGPACGYSPHPRGAHLSPAAESRWLLVQALRCRASGQVASRCAGTHVFPGGCLLLEQADLRFCLRTGVGEIVRLRSLATPQPWPWKKEGRWPPGSEWKQRRLARVSGVGREVCSVPRSFCGGHSPGDLVCDEPLEKQDCSVAAGDSTPALCMCCVAQSLQDYVPVFSSGGRRVSLSGAHRLASGTLPASGPAQLVVGLREFLALPQRGCAEEPPAERLCPSLHVRKR